MDRVYLDHAATTPLDPAVLEIMQPYFSEKFGNPSSIHHTGHEAALALQKARSQAAEVLRCRPHEIIFTSGGTESNNLALKGAAEARPPSLKLRGASNFSGHIITSAIEHHAVYDMAKYLQARGAAVTFVAVDRYGQVNPDDIIKTVRDDTFLVSIMYANNEIGTIQPIVEIGKEVQRRKIIMHTDAVQAAGFLPLNVEKLHVDLLSLSAHKFYGPKGAGLLYCRRGVKLAPQQIGGGQEFKMRASTENMPGIIGLAAALERAEAKREHESHRLSAIRDWLIQEVKQAIPSAILTGHPAERLPNNVSFCFPGLEGEALVMRLSERGYDCSSGSACTTGRFEPSPVLLALGLQKEVALGSLRISLGKSTTREDLAQFVAVLQEEIEKLT